MKKPAISTKSSNSKIQKQVLKRPSAMIASTRASCSIKGLPPSTMVSRIRTQGLPRIAPMDLCCTRRLTLKAGRKELCSRAERLGTLKSCGQAIVLHNGGDLGNVGRRGGDYVAHKAVVYTGTKHSCDFGYAEFASERGGKEPVPDGAISPHDFRILSLHHSMAGAQQALKSLKTARRKSYNGTLAITSLPIFGTDAVKIGKELHAVRGITQGQGDGVCLFGIFTSEFRAEDRACQMIAGVKEVSNDRTDIAKPITIVAPEDNAFFRVSLTVPYTDQYMEALRQTRVLRK